MNGMIKWINMDVIANAVKQSSTPYFWMASFLAMTHAWSNEPIAEK
jgi:hypothetical protein